MIHLTESKHDRPHTVTVKDFPRVAQVIGRFDRGGAQHLACNLSDAYVEMGGLCIIVGLAMDVSVASDQDDIQRGARRFVIDARGSLWRQLCAAFAFRRLVRHHSIELLHVHGVNCLRFVDMVIRGMRKRPRVAFTWHDSTSMVGARDQGRKNRQLQRALGRCDLLFGSSQQVAQRLSEATGRNAFALANGTAITEIPQQVDREIPVIVWAGRFVPEKDLLVLLNALANLKQEGVAAKLKVLGAAPQVDSVYERSVHQRIGALGLQNDVELLGWVEDVEAILRYADIAVQTSLSEGLSMALLEQMMAGLAIVATNVGDTAEALDDGRCGLLIRPGDEASLVTKLRLLIANVGLRRELGYAARQRATEHYSLESMARQATAAYQQALKQKSRKPSQT